MNASSDLHPSVRQCTTLTAEEFDALVTTLDVADDAPALVEAVRRPRRFTVAAEG